MLRSHQGLNTKVIQKLSATNLPQMKAEVKTYGTWIPCKSQCFIFLLLIFILLTLFN